MLAVTPATSQIDLNKMNQQFDRELSLATKQELMDLFNDCEQGAIPPLGEAYGYEVVVDDSLMDLGDIYFEAGDHTDLVHIDGMDFGDLMSNAIDGDFSAHI